MEVHLSQNQEAQLNELADLSVKKIEDESCEFRNTVHSTSTQ